MGEVSRYAFYVSQAVKRKYVNKYLQKTRNFGFVSKKSRLENAVDAQKNGQKRRFLFSPKT